MQIKSYHFFFKCDYNKAGINIINKSCTIRHNIQLSGRAQ